MHHALLVCLTFCQTHLYETTAGPRGAACYCCDGNECDLVERTRYKPLFLTLQLRAHKPEKVREDDRPELDYGDIK